MGLDARTLKADAQLSPQAPLDISPSQPQIPHLQIERTENENLSDMTGLDDFQQPFRSPLSLLLQGRNHSGLEAFARTERSAHWVLSNGLSPAPRRNSWAGAWVFSDHGCFCMARSEGELSGSSELVAPTPG